MTRKKGHFIDKDEMLLELKKSQEQGRCTERLGQIFILLAENLTNHRYFNRYTYKDELIGAGIEAMLKAYNKFDVSRGTSPLAYYTQICYFAFRGVCKYQLKHQNIRDAIKHDMGQEVSLNYELWLKEQEELDKFVDGDNCEK